MEKIEGSTVVLFKNNKRNEVFLVFRSDYLIWGITGGGIEKGESPRQAATREAFEETGVKTKITRKVGQYSYTKRGTIYNSFLFEGRVLSGKFCPEFPGCKGKWFKVNNLPISMTDRTKVKILDCVKHTSGQFKKEGWPFLLKNNIRLLIRHPLTVLKYIYKKHFEKAEL